jgi:DNA-directed RNA polymerase subunit RPC12/RpoP
MKKTCLHCGYTWTPRIETEPKACPYCKSPRGNEEKRKAGRPKQDKDNSIKKIIDLAIEQEWFDHYTTSDLQGVCEAAAMALTKDPREVMEISDKILNGIYKHQEATK